MKSIRETPSQLRRDRVELRDLAQTAGLQGDGRLSTCGAPLSGDVQLVRALDGSGHMTGVETCSSVHACPTCAVKIRTARAVELAAVVDRYVTEGLGTVFFMTLTFSHSSGDSLASSLDALGRAWGLLTSGKGWQDRHAAIGAELLDSTGVGKRRIHVVRSLDMTYSDANGWHPHYHCLVFCRPGVTAGEVKRQVVDRWIGIVGRNTDRDTVEYLNDVRPVRESSQDSMAVYAMKAGLEMFRHDGKLGRGSSRSPWALLHDALQGDTAAAELWAEYRTATFGLKSAQWTTDLLRWAKLDDSATADEDLAIGDLSGSTVECLIDRRTIVRIRRRPGLVADLLLVFEDGGTVAVDLWLLAWGYPPSMPPPELLE